VIMTILEAHVELNMVPALQTAYQNGFSHLPLGMIQTFLTQSVTDKTLWRIISIWESREALDEMLRSVETPEGVLMFRAAGAEEPQRSVFDIAAAAP